MVRVVLFVSTVSAPQIKAVMTASCFAGSEVLIFLGRVCRSLVTISGSECLLLGMDVYGYLLAREGRLEDVENLGCRLFNISDQHAEPWVVSG